MKLVYLFISNDDVNDDDDDDTSTNIEEVYKKVNFYEYLINTYTTIRQTISTILVLR